MRAAALRGHGRRTGAAATVLLPLVVVALLASPSGLAGPVAGVNGKSPFAGSAQTTTTKLLTGCGRVHVSVPDRFSMRTGLGGFAGSVSTKFCSSGLGGAHSTNSAFVTGLSKIEVLLPSFSGSHLVLARLTVAARGNESVALGTCTLKSPATVSECNQSAFWDAGVDGGEVFASGGSSYWYSSNLGGGFSNWSGSVDICRASGCVTNVSYSGNHGGASGSTNVSVYVNVTGAYPGLTYYLALYLYADAGASCSSSAGSARGCAARSVVDTGPPGFGIKLDSVRVY